MFLNELNDPLADFVANAAYKHPVSRAIIGDCRVFNRPFQTPEGAGENRTSALDIAFTERYEKGNALTHERVNPPGLLPGNINSNFQHHGYRIRIESSPCFRARTEGFKRSPPMSRKKASAICVRHEFFEQRNSTFGRIIK